MGVLPPATGKDEKRRENLEKRLASAPQPGVYDEDGNDLIERIRRNGISNVLNPGLFGVTEITKLRRLIRTYGEDDVLTAIADVCLRTAKGGSGTQALPEILELFRGCDPRPNRAKVRRDIAEKMPGMKRLSSEVLESCGRLERAERNGIVIAWSVKPLAGGAELISIVNMLHSHLRRRGVSEDLLLAAKRWATAPAAKKRRMA
jgi:hypothetical protein